MSEHRPLDGGRSVTMRFSAIIGKTGINPCVDLPEPVSASLGRTGYIPVMASLNGHDFRAGLVPIGHGRHRLFVNGRMRAAAGVDVGDRVDVALELDPEPRTRNVPEKLASALDADPILSARWDALTPSRRNEILDYVNSLKRPDTVARTVDKILRTLRAEEQPGPENE